MDKPQNKYIAVSYKLYSLKDGEKSLEEATSIGRPYYFISGFGLCLDVFEANIVGLEKGSTFDFVIKKEDAFGDYDPDGVHTLSRELFSVDGRFDAANIYPGAFITLMDDEERRFMVRVAEVGNDTVTVDANHPFAGMDLQYTGEVVENREATNEEIQDMLNRLSGGCGGGCDDCDGHCGK